MSSADRGPAALIHSYPTSLGRSLTLCVNVLEFEAFKRVLLARRQQMGKVAPLYLIKCAD